MQERPNHKYVDTQLYLGNEFSLPYLFASCFLWSLPQQEGCGCPDLLTHSVIRGDLALPHGDPFFCPHSGIPLHQARVSGTQNTSLPLPSPVLLLSQKCVHVLYA